MDRLDELEKLRISIEHSRKLLNKTSDDDDEEPSSKGVIDDLFRLDD